LKRALPVLLVLAVVPSAAGGNYVPPAGDRSPVWSPDGTRIAFSTTRGGSALAVVQSDGSGEARIHAGHAAALSPDWKRLAELRADQELLVDGMAIARRVHDFAWAPSSDQLVFSSGQGLFVVDTDGSDILRIADSGSSGLWSPTGELIAYQKYLGDRFDLHIVAPDGSGDRNLTPEDDLQSIRPIWSPDGRSLAYIKNARTPELHVVEVDGRSRRLPVKVQITNGEVAWFPDGGRVAVEAGGGVVSVDVATGRVRKWLPFATGLAWSRDGTRLAFSAGGECRDRRGIYVAEGDGTRVRRITNDCRIVGTNGPDRLAGTALADVLLGLRGNDRLAAEDPGYMGDTLEGGEGADLLIGDFQRDTLKGGPGADVLRGGPSGDLLVGGPGRDVINGQGGLDVIEARDGTRDRLSCGTNRDNTRPERDTVYADRLDRVSRDCEVVRRR
jgi:Ca2+-binding RTX toxin-like protein